MPSPPPTPLPPRAGRVVLDAAEWPLVQVAFVGSLSDEAFEHYLRGYAALVERGPCAAVFDARASAYTSAKHRRRQADWLREHEPLLRRHVRGVAFCVSSALIRGAITAVFWLQPPPSPYLVTGSLAEAKQWARARLAAAGALGPG